jgi:D-alanyl-D-alanine carboxypeptidase
MSTPAGAARYRPIMPRPLRLVALAVVCAILALGFGYGTGLIGRPPNAEPAAAAANSSPSPAVSRRPASPPASGHPDGTPTPPRSVAPVPSPSDAPPAPSPSPPIPPSATTELVSHLDRALERQRVRRAIPGISATIIFADGTSWTGTSGYADLRAKEPVSADTAFAAASISKTFAAAAALQLVESGRLALRDRVAVWLPTLGLDRRITVRMLLNHTSGLHDFFFDPRIDRALLADRAAAWTSARSLRYVGKPYFKPGRGWHYSNTNYLVLGLLIEHVTGRSLANEVRDRFIDPLGLEDTYTQALEEPRGDVANAYRFASGSRRAQAIDLSDGTVVMPFRSVVTAAGAAGSIAGSSSDLARWARELYGGTILEPATVALMTDAARTSRFKPRVPYGLGAQAVSIDGRAAVGHSGRFLGMRGVMRWLPGERIAIVVLTNQSRRDPGVVAGQLLRVVLGPPPEVEQKACQSCPPAH